MEDTREKQWDDCWLNYTLSIIGGKYCSSVLYTLSRHDGGIRFNELKHSIPRISCKTLSNTLKKLEEDALLTRKEFPQIPPRVEYSLTEKGRSVLPVLQAMHAWGKTCCQADGKTGGSSGHAVS